MTSPTLDNTHGGTTSGVACHHRLWTANTVDNVERGMPSTPRDNTHGTTMLGVSCYHHLSVARTVRRRRAWHAITALGRQTPSNDVRRGMPSSPLGSRHGRTSSGLACHHHLWEAHRIELCWALHAIIAFWKHTRSDDVGRGMTSSPLDNIHGRQRRAWHDDITSLGQNTRSATSSVA